MSPPVHDNSEPEKNDALAVESDCGLPATPGPVVSGSGEDQTRHIGLQGDGQPRPVDRIPQQLGSYRILAPLGKGGMGEVLDAWDDLLDRPVAIKIIASRYADDPTLYRRLQIEARAAARLSHPNIVTVYQLGEEGMVSYIAMEKLEGESLSHVLRARGRLDPKEAVRMVRGAIEALAYAADRSVIHRDIKPANLMVLSDGTIKVLDFGLAKRLDSDDPGLTATNCHVGTPLYMSPEQAAGEKCDHRTDIYAMGITLYQMVVGHPPFQAASPVAIAMKHASTPLPISDELKTPVGSAFSVILNRMTAKDPKNRYATYAELLADLDAFLGDRPLDAVHGKASEGGFLRGRTPWLVGAAIPILLVIVWATSRSNAPTGTSGVVARLSSVAATPRVTSTQDSVLADERPAAVIDDIELDTDRPPRMGGPGRPPRGRSSGSRMGPPEGPGRAEQGPLAGILARIKSEQENGLGITELALEGKLDEVMNILTIATQDERNSGTHLSRLVEDMRHTFSAAAKFANEHFEESQSFEERVQMAVLLAKVDEGPTRFDAIMYLLACSPEDGEAAWDQYLVDSPRDANRPEREGPVNMLRVVHASSAPTE